MRQRGMVIALVLVCWVSGLSFGFSGGTGDSWAPYQVSTAADLAQVRSYPTAHFILLNDIDLQNASFSNNVAAATFAGNFNGNGYSILNYTVTNSSGFFYVLNGTVRNLSLLNAVYNAANNSGGMAYQTGFGG